MAVLQLVKSDGTMKFKLSYMGFNTSPSSKWIFVRFKDIKPGENKNQPKQYMNLLLI